MCTGESLPSDNSDTENEPECHGVQGVYLTELLEAYGEYYARPGNVFGDKCLYGINDWCAHACLRVLCV